MVCMAFVVVHEIVRVALKAIVIVVVSRLVWCIVEMALYLAISVCRHCMRVTWDLSVALRMSATRRWLFNDRSGLFPWSPRDWFLEQRSEIQHWRLDTFKSMASAVLCL